MTIVEIARHFNVSPVTVSNALNYKKGVSPDKAQIIRRYAGEVGFRPSYLAKSLLSGRTGLVGLCLRAEPTNPWYISLIGKIQNHLFRQDLYLNTIIAHQADLGEEAARERVLWTVDFFEQIKAEAIIVGPMDSRHWEQMAPHLASRANTVIFGCVEKTGRASVALDVADGIRQGLGFLTANGHRNIGYIGVNRFEEENPHLTSRYSCFLQYLQEHHLPLVDHWLVRWRDLDRSELVVQELRMLLASGRELPDAFFCHDDNFAAMTIRTLAEFNLRVPDDISLIGFDNQPISGWTLPGITTIGFDLDHYAEKLTDFILAEIDARRNGGSTGELFHCEPTNLILRGSVKNKRNGVSQR